MIMILIFLNYGIVSIGLIVYLIILLGSGNQFNNSFYRLVQWDMSLNILTYLSSWVNRLLVEVEARPAMVYLYYNFHFIYTASAFSSHFFYHIQSFSTMILCAQRLTFIRSASANMFWSKYYTAVYVCMILLAFLICYPLFVFGFYNSAVYDESKDSFAIAPTEQWKVQALMIFFSIITKVYFIIITIGGCFTLFELKKRLSVLDQSIPTKKIMKNMTIITLINTSIYLLVVIYQITTSTLFIIKDIPTVIILQSITSDVLSLSMPYVLLFCDWNVRLRVSQKMCFPLAGLSINVSHRNNWTG